MLIHLKLNNRLFAIFKNNCHLAVIFLQFISINFQFRLDESSSTE
ncbi:Hypothetical protein ADU71_1554 [Pediococcus damnosus]|nr:Hypothetical protein ADU69_1433 [Pediococcus damnosus]AMV65446.1 Hypothetical protein ADU71_1554 [Pediococcus damnosus]